MFTFTNLNFYKRKLYKTYYTLSQKKKLLIEAFIIMLETQSYVTLPVPKYSINLIKGMIIFSFYHTRFDFSTPTDIV